MLKMSGWQRQSQNQSRNLRREASTDSPSTFYPPILSNTNWPLKVRASALMGVAPPPPQRREVTVPGMDEENPLFESSAYEKDTPSFTRPHHPTPARSTVPDLCC